MRSAPLTVAWITDFPVEWLPEVPEPMRSLPKGHPQTWQQVLLGQFEKRADVDLHIICLRKRIERDVSFARNGVHFHITKVRGNRLALCYWPDTWSVRRALRTISPRIVHAWGMERAAGLVAQRLGLPHLITMQGILSWLSETTRLNPYFQVMRFFERYALRRARVVSVESSFGMNYLKSKYPGAAFTQVEHAPAPMFHEALRAPELRPARFLFVGTLSAAKGTDVLLAALDRLRGELDFRLSLIGRAVDGFQPELDVALRSQLGARIDYRESAPPAEIAGEMARSALLIFPTLADNSPNVVKEAVAAGVPVIASDVGGIPDYVVPGMNGLLFRPGDLESCIQAIRAAARHPLLGQGSVDRATLVEKRNYLSPETMARKFIDAYDLTLRLFGGAPG